MSRVRSVAVACIAAASLLLLLGYSAAWWPGGVPTWVAVAFAVATVLQLGGFTALGAVARTGRLGHAAWGIAGMMLLVGGALVYAIVAPDLGAQEPLVLGLPRRAAVIIVGVGILPLVALAWAFVRHFAEWAPRAEKHDEQKHDEQKHEKHGRTS